ncbi:MAG: hypothetical protein ACFCU2_05490 [Acidimicrobiia bacterium]
MRLWSGITPLPSVFDVYGSLFEEDLERLADTMEERYGSVEGDNVVRLPG